MRVTNPALVYYRMLADVARLRDWADRMGNETHKSFARELERILILKQALFTADLTAAKPAERDDAQGPLTGVKPSREALEQWHAADPIKYPRSMIEQAYPTNLKGNS